VKCLDSSKKRLLKDIEAFDIRDNYSDLNKEAQLKRMELISQLKVTDNKIESLCMQKARASWLIHGDSNSKYYHSVIRWQRLRNEVKGG